MQLLWSIGKGYSLLIKSSKSSKCEQINITKTSLTKQIVSDQFMVVTIWYTQSQQIKLVKQILAMFFKTRHTWLDQANQIELLRLSWSNQLEQISWSNNDEQIKLVKWIW